MWRNHRIVIQDHLKYIRNDIVKPLYVVILCYTERVQEMHDLAKHLPPTMMKGDSFEVASWEVRVKELSVHEIRVYNMDTLPLYIEDELEDNQEDYCYFTNEYWCDFLSTIEIKDNRNR